MVPDLFLHAHGCHRDAWRGFYYSASRMLSIFWMIPCRMEIT